MPAQKQERGARRTPTALTAFLCVLAAIFAAYTVLALDMDWRAPAGRLGPAFFPRVIGVLGIVLCCIAAVRSLRPAPRKARQERHPRTLVATVGGMAGFLFLLIPLGAVLTSGLFLFAVLELLERGHVVRNAAVSVLISVSLYVIFEVLLNAGLPQGPLPL